MNKCLTLESAVDAIIKYNPSYSPTVFKDIFERYGKFEDVEPVQHGHWIKTGWQRGDLFEYKCSECKRNKIWKKKSQKLSNYCDKCGTKMDGKENE